MKNIAFTLLLTGFSLFTLNSCDKEKEALSVPSAYDSSTFLANTTQEYEIRAQLKTLVDEMKKGRVELFTLSAGTLISKYNTGNKSLASITLDDYNNRIPNYLNEMAAASGGSFDPTLPVVGNGGTYGGSSKYLFDENGVEFEQLVDKGLFGAALYHYTTTQLLTGEVNQVKLDQALAIFGAHPDFANSNDATKHTNPDVNGAVYAARRDDNSGNGFYLTIKQNFIKAQAAIKAGSDYNEERNEAITAIKTNWEKALAATVINYCYDGINKLSSTTPTDETRAGALHSLGEAVGFTFGLRNNTDKIISDAKIEEVLSQLRHPLNGTPTMHEFVKNPVSAVSNLETVINILKAEYGFTTQELESFKKNWVSEQQR